MDKREHVKVLFVCMGNICRSPTAQGVFSKVVQEAGLAQLIAIDSAGTHAFHVDEPPDPRAQMTARARGINLAKLRARRATPADLEAFDYILAMDTENYACLAEICPPGMDHKLKLLMDFAPDLNVREVPDPYYGGVNGFERVFDMVEAAADGLLAEIRQRHGL